MGQCRTKLIVCASWQKTMLKLLEDCNAGKFTSSLDYGQPDSIKEFCWMNLSTLNPDNPEMVFPPFAHVSDLQGVKSFILLMLGVDVSNHQLGLMAPGESYNDMETTTLQNQQNVRAADEDPNLNLFLKRVFLHVDGVQVKGLSKELGKTVTVFRLRLSKMMKGLCQLRSLTLPIEKKGGGPPSAGTAPV